MMFKMGTLRCLSAGWDEHGRKKRKEKGKKKEGAAVRGGCFGN